MDSHHFTRSKACRPSVSQAVSSDVEPDDVTPATEISGPVRLQGRPIYGCERARVGAAAASRAPFCRRPGGGWKWRIRVGSSLLVGPPECPGDHVDPAEGKKGKVFPYSLPSVGPGADPGVQAVSPQVT